MEQIINKTYENEEIKFFVKSIYFKENNYYLNSCIYFKKEKNLTCDNYKLDEYDLKSSYRFLIEDNYLKEFALNDYIIEDKNLLIFIYNVFIEFENDLKNDCEFIYATDSLIKLEYLNNYWDFCDNDLGEKIADIILGKNKLEFTEWLNEKKLNKSFSGDIKVIKIKTLIKEFEKEKLKGE